MSWLPNCLSFFGVKRNFVVRYEGPEVKRLAQGQIRAHIEVQVQGNNRIALLDGDAQACLMSFSTFEATGLQLKPTTAQFRGFGNVIRGAMGCCKAKLRVGNVTMQHNFFVMEDNVLPSHVVLGQSFLKRFKDYKVEAYGRRVLFNGDNVLVLQ